MDFAAIQAQVAQLQHPDRLGQQQNLDEQLFQFGQKGLTKMGNRIMVRMQIARNEPKRDAFVST